MLDIDAAVGLAQLWKYPCIIQCRRDSALWYDKHLERRAGWVFPPLVEGATYSHYVVRVPNRKQVFDEWSMRDVELGMLIQYSIPSLPEYQILNRDICINASKASMCTVNFPVRESF